MEEVLNTNHNVDEETLNNMKEFAEEHGIENTIYSFGVGMHRVYLEDDIRLLEDTFGEPLREICLNSNRNKEYQNEYTNASMFIAEAVLRTSSITGVPVKTLIKTNVVKDITAMVKYIQKVQNDRTRSTSQQEQTSSNHSE